MKIVKSVWQEINTMCDDTIAEWCLCPEDLTLTLGDAETGRWIYQIDLDDMTNCAQMLDCILQVAGKPWHDPGKVVCEFIAALNEIYEPQATLCSSGKECGPIDPKESIDEYVRLCAMPSRKRSGM